MKHKFILLAFGLFCTNFIMQAQQRYPSVLPVQQQLADSRVAQDIGEGRVLYGYSSPDAEITEKNGVGYKKDVKATVAIRFSEGINSLLKGKKIYSFKVGVVADVENATLFVRKADGTTLWEKTTSMQFGWNEITLDTPFEMPEVSELYIGYTYMQASGVYVAAVAGTSKLNGLLMAEGDEYLEDISTFGNLCLLVEVDGTKSNFDYVGSLKTVYAPSSYLPKGGDQTLGLGLTFFNEGESNVSRITLGRSVNGVEASDTVCIFKRTVKPNNEGKFIFNVSPEESTKYVFTLKKIETAEVSVSSKTAAVSVYDTDDAIQRMVLAEEFTSQSCGNCPTGQMALHDLIKGREDRVALVLHHSGYEPDFFTILESENYVYFYNTARTYAPAMMMDRTYFSELDAQFTGISPVFDPRHLVESQLVDEIDAPAMVSVGIESSYDEKTRQLKVSLSGYKITDLVGDRVGLNVFLLESKYIAWQNSTSGRREEFEHNNFLRATLSNVKGDVITFNPDGTYRKEYTYTIPEEYISTMGVKTKAHPENMTLVAFVANLDTTYPDNCVVLNANKTSSLNDYVSGIESEKAIEKENRVYVNEGTIYVVGEYKNFQLYNMQGMVVRNEGLAPGIYIVKIMGKNHKESVEKIFVQ